MQEKTEQPTEKKLRDARDRGEVVRSADVVSSAVFVVLLALIGLGGAYFWAHLREVALLPNKLIAAGNISERLPWFFERLLTEFVLLSLPLIVAACFTAGLAAFFQVRSVFSIDPVIPKMERLNPIEGLQRIFSTRGVIGVALMIVKVLLLGGIVFFVIRASVGVVVKAPYLDAAQIRTLAGGILTPVFAWSAVVYCLMAAIDYLHQHYEFMKQNKMSIDEVRREYKDQEGDPLIKSKRRALYQELTNNRMMDNVRKASVVVVNPTHIAVALFYEAGKTGLPVVVAKGADGLAARIRAVAEEANVPILRNVKLARDLYESIPLDHNIGSEHVDAVVEVLRWVKRLHESRRD